MKGLTALANHVDFRSVEGSSRMAGSLLGQMRRNRCV